MKNEKQGRGEISPERQMELENRIKNLFWTVCGDYAKEIIPDVKAYVRTPEIAQYDIIKQGAFARFYDLDQLSLYVMKKLYLSADDRIFPELVQLGVDAAAFSKVCQVRLGAAPIRKAAFAAMEKELEKHSEQSEIHLLKKYWIRQFLQEDTEADSWKKEEETYPVRIRQCARELRMLEKAENTDEIITGLEHIYNTYWDPAFEEQHGDLKQVLQVPLMALAEDAWKECHSDEQMEKILKKYTDNIKKDMMRLARIKNRKMHMPLSFSEQGTDGEEDGEPDPAAVQKVQDYVELNFGKSYLTPLEQQRANRKYCRGIHAGCTLYYTEGILGNPVKKNNQYRFTQMQVEKNRLYYYNFHRLIKRNIAALTELLNKTMIMSREENSRMADSGILIPSRLWKLGRTQDPKLFHQVQKASSSEFVVDILLDSSGSQAKRQSKVAIQGYMVSKALSAVGIPHRVTSYCTFWGYTVLQRFRDYEDSSDAIDRIFEFRAYANNRDGLAIRAVSDTLLQRQEENKILIILSDGKPCDLEVKRPGIPHPLPYVGETAVRDTALEVRKVRNAGISVLGVYVGEEEDLPAEKRIFGKDFAYIRNISSFSRVTGTYLKRQLDNGEI